ncbi:MAG: dihydroneopterin aldolase [Bdellovibrionales bacterium]|nr:dihydroneopterin aldolase [Bdellovibrionales bacterium]
MKEAFTIRLNKFRILARIGCTVEERQFPQIVLANIEIAVGSHEALESDVLEQTCDYIEVVKIVEQLVQEKEWNLLEKMAKEVAMAILNRYQIASKVAIEIGKSVATQVESLGVRVVIERQSSEKS